MVRYLPPPAHVMARYGTFWYVMVRYGTLWYVMVRYGTMVMGERGMRNAKDLICVRKGSRIHDVSEPIPCVLTGKSPVSAAFFGLCVYQAITV
jgi:hypothetical protein